MCEVQKKTGREHYQQITDLDEITDTVNINVAAERMTNVLKMMVNECAVYINQTN